MAYKKGDRNQITFLPACIDGYVSKNDPVRFYDSFIESIDLNELNIRYQENLKGILHMIPKQC